MDVDASLIFRITVILLFCAFPPLMTYTYWRLRHHRRENEIKRVMKKLEVDEDYFKSYQIRYTPADYIIAVLYTVILSAIGLVLVLLPAEVGLTDFPKIVIDGTQIPQDGSRFIFAMGFCGAYLWGQQHILRRYSQNDLLPVVFYSFCLRLVLAPLLAMFAYIAFGALPGSENSQTGGAILWPAVGFMIGMFPQRGLRWLSERLPVFKHGDDGSVRAVPLSLIEGIEIHDKLRLEEVGIDSCYDLASADFVPLILKTPYNARELVDWIMQAKLCVYAGTGIVDLREHGFRTILDFQPRSEDDDMESCLERLAAETSVTHNMLLRAYASVNGNEEIDRIRRAGLLLGKYANVGLKPDSSEG